MRILIIRHAEPDYANHTLTPKGFREAEILSERLGKLKVKAIYASPMERARFTAEPTAKKLGLPVQVLPWLHEFQGRIIGEDGNACIPWNQDPRVWSEKQGCYDIRTWVQDYKPQETVPSEYEQVKKEFLAFLQTYGYTQKGVSFQCAVNRDETILIFCHFALGMVLTSVLTAISPVLLWQSLFLPTSSVSTFITEEHHPHEVTFKCLQLGDTSHLYAAGEPISNAGLYPEFFPGYEWRESIWETFANI